MQTSTMKRFWQQGRKKRGGGADRDGGGERGWGWKIRVSETVKTNHNQMGKLSNSGKSWLRERKGSTEGKEGKEGGKKGGGTNPNGFPSGNGGGGRLV